MNRIDNKKNVNDLDYWDNYYKTNEVNKAMDNRLVFYDKISKWLERGKKTFLEIGCATGYGLELLAKKFPEYKFTGYDFSPVAIEKAGENNQFNNLSYFEYDIYKDKIKIYFDYIAIIETLEHLENPEMIIKTCLEHCDKLIITVPFEACCSTSTSHIITNFNRKSFCNFGKIINFEIFEVRGYFNKDFLYMGVMIQ